MSARVPIEESGLWYYRARYYDPAVGRFLQRDPLGYSQEPCLYCYSTSNPCNYSDPTGAEPRKVIIKYKPGKTDEENATNARYAIDVYNWQEGRNRVSDSNYTPLYVEKWRERGLLSDIRGKGHQGKSWWDWHTEVVGPELGNVPVNGGGGGGGGVSKFRIVIDVEYTLVPEDVDMDDPEDLKAHEDWHHVLTSAVADRMNREQQWKERTSRDRRRDRAAFRKEFKRKEEAASKRFDDMNENEGAPKEDANATADAVWEG